MIRGVIFDMDGTMFDTERMWATFWVPALARLGLEYREGLAEAERGTAGETSLAIVRQFYGPDCDAKAIIDSLHQEADAAFSAAPVPKSPAWTRCWTGWRARASLWRWLPPAAWRGSAAIWMPGA